MEKHIKEIETKIKSSKYFILKKDSINVSYIFSDLEFLKINDDCIKVIGNMECLFGDDDLEFLNERPSNKTTILSARTHTLNNNFENIYDKLEWNVLNKLNAVDEKTFYEIKNSYDNLMSLLNKIGA